jgi:hypothetical protein
MIWLCVFLLLVLEFGLALCVLFLLVVRVIYRYHTGRCFLRVHDNNLLACAKKTDTRTKSCERRNKLTQHRANIMLSFFVTELGNQEYSLKHLIAIPFWFRRWNEL